MKKEEIIKRAKVKKIFLLLLIVLNFISCNNLEKEEKAKEYICQELKKYTGENFWFIKGLDRERSFGTEVKYRGIIYSERLQKIRWREGLEIGLSSLDNINTKFIVYKYASLMKSTKIESIVEEKAREMFGDKIIFYNVGMTTDHMYSNIMNNQGINLERLKKSTYEYSVLNIFVDDLEKVDVEEYRKKVFEFGKYMSEHMNIKSALNVEIRDDKVFENYNLIRKNIAPMFMDNLQVKEICEKIKRKEKLSNEEKQELIYAFYKGGFDDYEISSMMKFMFRFKREENFPIEIRNVKYERKVLGVTTYYED